MDNVVACKKSNYNVIIPLKNERCLIYNTLSHGFALLPQEEYDYFKSGNNFLVKIDHSSGINDFASDMLENGFIIPDNIDELSVLDDQYNNARNSEEILILTVTTTIACNFACDYCFQDHDYKSGMSQEVQDKICEFVEYYSKVKSGKFKHLHICFYGGEPLIKFNIIQNLSERFIKFCNENSIKYSAEIVTNGYFLNLEKARELVKYKINQCQITLDGDRDSHDSRRHLLSKKGTFDRIISNITSYIKEVPLFTSIRINIDKRNAEGASRLLDCLSALGLSNNNNLKVYFAPVESTTSACKGIETFTLQKSELSKLMFKLYVEAVEKGLHHVVMPPRMLGLCTAAKKNAFVIAPDGTCHKCWDIVTFKELGVGNIFEYEKLLDNHLHNDNGKKWNDFSPLKNEVCRNCVILPNCFSSCPYKFIHVDQINGASILPCPDWKFNIKEKLIFLAVKQGFISHNDYDQECIKTDPLELSLAAKYHTIESMRKINVINDPKIITYNRKMQV